ncbi:MAG TPA: hypothetical protein VG225_14775 [Terracidiphilus sp.]|nr:hypothetical protein [Terracidiphilus sp.]
MKLFRLLVTGGKTTWWSYLARTGLLLLFALAAHAAANSPWEQPSASLAEQIAGVLGPGQARLTLRNISSIPTSDLPAIRRTIEDNLQARGVTVTSEDSANNIRVTLSENARERLWVAEIMQGSQTQVVMVRVDREPHLDAPSDGGVILRKQAILTTNVPVLSAMEFPGGIVALEPEQIAIFTRGADGSFTEKDLPLRRRHALTRDPRGMLLPSANGTSIEAWLPGTHCEIAYPAAQTTGDAKVQCHESDDPWPMATAPIAATSDAQPPGPQTTQVKAFFNPARNFFTGVVVPSQGVDLPAFYGGALLPRTMRNFALVIGGTDGRVQIAENGALQPLSGTGDWGSDFAALASGCKGGTQIVASSSGGGGNDSLRAYEVTGLDAVPASVPLPMNGTVTAAWESLDGKSVWATVRAPGTPGTQDSYEVDRVTANCN